MPNIGGALCSTPQSLVNIQSPTAEIRRGKKKKKKKERKKQDENIMVCPII